MKLFVRGTASCITALTLFCALNGQAQQSQPSVSELVKSSVDAVVLIVVSDENGKPTVEGSGFIVSSDGKIVTNHHVVSGAHSAIVKLNNGAFFSVEGVLADDLDHDITVIKVAGKNLPFLGLEDSDSLSVGDHVLAIGSPLGLENSVSDGIISGFREDSNGRSWIQTTAPASHGNSGGPLLGMDGRVAGIVTFKSSEGENLNFASPSKLINPLLAKSALQPLGTMSRVDSSTAPSVTGESIWTSMTSGRDYKVRIDGDYIYTEWVDLPSALKSTTAFSRSELKKQGGKWIGKTIAYMPFNYKQYDVTKTIWCRVEVDTEIDKMSASRIEGESQLPASFNAKKCQPEKLEWKAFTWIPK
jgi:hypothetical protein